LDLKEETLKNIYKKIYIYVFSNIYIGCNKDKKKWIHMAYVYSSFFVKKNIRKIGSKVIIL